MKDLFIEFLKSNNAYDEFVNNLLIQNDRITFDEYFADKEFDGLLDALISDAFTWSHTNKYEDSDKSHEYWSNLNEKWEELYNTKTK